MEANGMETNPEREYIRRHHKHQLLENQCSSALVKHIKAPVHIVWSLVREFYQPQKYKHLATIGLAADENPLGVVLGGIVAQTLCTTAAVIGGKSLASQISERIVALSGGMLFIIFGIQSFLSPVDA